MGIVINKSAGIANNNLNFQINSNNNILETLKKGEIKPAVYIHLDDEKIYVSTDFEDDEKEVEDKKETPEVQEDKGGEAGRSEDGTVNIAKMLELTEEEIEQMSPEELVELFKDACNAALIASSGKDPYGSEEAKKLMQTFNAVGTNKLLMTLVSKMSDEKLDEFMKAYKEMYPSRKLDDGTYMFGSFEDIASDIMWTNYTYFAKVATKEEVYEYLERMRKYFPKLNDDPSVRGGIVQWA